MQSAEIRMQNYGVPRYAERIVYAYGGITSQYKYGYDNRGNLVRSIDINDRGDFRKKAICTLKRTEWWILPNFHFSLLTRTNVLSYNVYAVFNKPILF